MSVVRCWPWVVFSSWLASHDLRYSALQLLGVSGACGLLSSLDRCLRFQVSKLSQSVISQMHVVCNRQTFEGQRGPCPTSIPKIWVLQNLIGWPNDYCKVQSFGIFYPNPYSNLIMDTSKFMYLACQLLNNHANQDSLAHVKTLCRLWRVLVSFCLWFVVRTTIFCQIQLFDNIFISSIPF